ncbi:hypothetical protein M0R45_026785 [Rubus argutus]|uniref:Uncharacterized protein n=1 Tax=Rubus argutus TaxID=59490 RepID=A0AAW1WZ59_RUBAR
MKGKTTSGRGSDEWVVPAVTGKVGRGSVRVYPFMEEKTVKPINNKPTKITYSTMEMEAMRFLNFLQQRNFCVWIPQELIFKGFLVPKPKFKSEKGRHEATMSTLILAAKKRKREEEAEMMNHLQEPHDKRTSMDEWILDRQVFKLKIQEVERRACASPLFQDNVRLIRDFHKLISNSS